LAANIHAEVMLGSYSNMEGTGMPVLEAKAGWGSTSDNKLLLLVA
jgi:hypothetical protein